MSNEKLMEGMNQAKLLEVPDTYRYQKLVTVFSPELPQQNVVYFTTVFLSSVGL